MHFDLIWTFVVIIFASIVIGWAAEITAIHLSAGIALAILAWLQTAPEFAVEATIAWSRDADLILANFTGSIRLLMGFGWPIIIFIHYWTRKQRPRFTEAYVELPRSFSVEAVSLIIPVLYFFLIWIKKAWTVTDGIILCSLYGLYFWLLNHQRKRSAGVASDEEDAYVVQLVRRFSNSTQALIAFFIFLVGGLALLFTVHPFIESLKATALALGVSQFVFIQWIAPIASELPEKVTAFNWARKTNKVAFAVVNMLSSIISQWTLMAGMVPLVFSFSAGTIATIQFTEFQRTEILLTLMQSSLAILFLADLRISAVEAVGMLFLWFIQFVFPSLRTTLIPVYGLWIIYEILGVMLNPKRCHAWIEIKHLFSSKALKK